MKAKLVKKLKGGLVSIYELSEPIIKGKSDLRGEIDVKLSIDNRYNILLPKFKETAEKYRKDDGYYIAISMAHTHIEKLVFPVLRITEDVFDITGNDIAGKHTYMINGGDASTVYADEVYLRYLATLNGLHFEGIEK